MNGAPRPDFTHVVHLTDRHGMFEHAVYAEPRPEHGYCTDDMARLLVVTARDTAPTAVVAHLRGSSLQFVVDAASVDGTIRNRMAPTGRWIDDPALDDAWGRAIWALGTVAGRSSSSYERRQALGQLHRATAHRSPHRRSMAFAALGAAEVLRALPGHDAARRLLTDAAAIVAERDPHVAWSWPETRLRYANAVVPEVLIAAGDLLDRADLLRQGLDLLGWLLEHESIGSHLSVTPVSGAGPGAMRPAFDQQPIEVAALADACARAERVDGDGRWSRGVDAAVAWFLGDNDVGDPMWDPRTGGGYDGLTPTGPNRNQGAESSLALLSTLQHAHRPAPQPA